MTSLQGRSARPYTHGIVGILPRITHIYLLIFYTTLCALFGSTYCKSLLGRLVQNITFNIIHIQFREGIEMLVCRFVSDSLLAWIMVLLQGCTCPIRMVVVSERQCMQLENKCLSIFKQQATEIRQRITCGTLTLPLSLGGGWFVTGQEDSAEG